MKPCHVSRLVRLLARAKQEAIISKMKAAGEELRGVLITCDQVRDRALAPHSYTRYRTRRYHDPGPTPYALLRILSNPQASHFISIRSTHQVVVHEDRILEKPGSVDEAHEYMEGYARSPASTVGSVLATDLASGREAEDVERVFVHLRPIPPDVREQLIAEGTVFYCAGGLMVRRRGEAGGALKGSAVVAA